MRKLIAAVCLLNVLLLLSSLSVPIIADSTATAWRFPTVTFANLSTPTNSNVRYCSNCRQTNPCTSGGSGAFAYRVGGSWVCGNGSSVTISDTAYDATSWNGNSDGATKNAIRDKFESLTPGTTINSTDGRVPYRASSSAFGDSPLIRDDANTLSQHNSTNAQSYYLYGTRADAGNYVRGKFFSNSTSMGLTAETAGSGSDDLDIVFTPAGTGKAKVGSVPFGEQALGTTDTPTFNTSAVIVEGKLNTVTLDLNTTDPQTFFTCPASKSCIVTKIVIRGASGNFSAADNLAIQATGGEFWGIAGFGNLDSPDKFRIVHAGQQNDGTFAGTPPSRLNASEPLTGTMGTAFGSVATCTIDVFGYVL